MLPKFILSAVFLFTLHYANAQNASVSGKVQDGQNKAALRGATVQLKRAGDSVIIKNALTDSAGSFSFSEIQPDSFLLVVSFVGYTPFEKGLRFDSSSLDLSINIFRGSATDLATVVIRSTAPVATQRGDTLQISADQYKVNPDASTEDLVKKMPGITIENGVVKAQGENVQKVTIDGRELFGDDATAALRNLPAEVVDKIQVFDRLSDQAQFSGVDDGNTTKGINIVTKANMRNGQFGRVFAGYGTDDRYAAGGNTTLLKENRRISIVGNFNNTNQQNFSQQDLLGVTSSSNNRGGGGQQGGNRGGGGGGNFGGGNFGGGGNNFLVGQQNGINKTNAFGINYSDVWNKKLTVTGSYFFNSTTNNTFQLGNVQYLNPAVSRIDRIADTTTASSTNTNHRVNMRFEWRIDSNNQLTIAPNLSFQENESYRRSGSNTIYPATSKIKELFNQNINNSSRAGNNLNNSIFYRHNFAKRGRSFSINLNTSYNKRSGGAYVNTFTRTALTNDFSDTATNIFTDQFNDGLQLSTNISYSEPLSQNAQLQFSYNPSMSINKSRQEAFNQNAADKQYTIFLDDFSNVFENRTYAHNGGLSYRWGNRDKQISFGANYQNTQLKSDRIFPTVAQVDKSFSNVLPNAQIRYKVSAKSSFRINYRTNVNQPSVTQLQDVIDPNNRPSYRVGNANLSPQYSHSLSTQYTYTNPAKSIVLVGNVFYQAASNYIASATYNSIGGDTVVNGVKLDTGYRLSKYINLDGYNTLRSFFTMAVPLKFMKSNLNLNGGISINTLPGMIQNVRNETKNTTYTLGAVIGSNVSQFIDFTFSYSANFNNVTSDVARSTPSSYFQHVGGLQFNLLSKKGWFFQNDLNNQYYNGLSEDFNQNYFLWNMSAGRKFLKGQKGELKLSVFDLLKQNRSINRTVTAERIEDEQNQVLQQFFMVTFSYNLRNFGTAAARNFNRGNREGERRF
ncbi:MAG: TonB-dependent receptor [Bacteroidota bacterium]